MAGIAVLVMVCARSSCGPISDDAGEQMEQRFFYYAAKIASHAILQDPMSNLSDLFIKLLSSHEIRR